MINEQFVDRIINILLEMRLDETLAPHPESQSSKKRMAKAAARKAARDVKPSTIPGLTRGEEAEISGRHAPVTPRDRRAGRRPVRPGSNEDRERGKQARKDNERHKIDMEGLEANYKSSAMPRK